VKQYADAVFAGVRAEAARLWRHRERRHGAIAGAAP